MVGLHVALGTATIQVPAASLDRDDGEIEAARAELLGHVEKCFNEALEKAREQWRKMRG